MRGQEAGQESGHTYVVENHGPSRLASRQARRRLWDSEEQAVCVFSEKA